MLASAAGRASALPSTTRTETGTWWGGDLGKAAQIRLGLHSEDLGDGRRVVGEVEAVGGTDFQDPTGQAGEQLSSVVEGALGVHGRTDPGIDAGPDRVALTGR